MIREVVARRDTIKESAHASWIARGRVNLWKGIQKKCSREESNLHGFPHTVLSRTRLPFRHVSAEAEVASDNERRKRKGSAAAAFPRAIFQLLGLARFT